MKLSSSLEDYLETIYLFVKKNGCAKVSEISKELNVAKASVTGALIALKEKELINYEPYSPITLTDKGLELAGQILKKHNILENFFVEVLGLNESEAEENACRIEHVVTEKMFARMEKLSGFIKKYASSNREFAEQLRKNIN